MNLQDKETEFKRLYEESLRHREQAQELREEVVREERIAHDLECQAVELIKPYKRSDVIEYQAMQGYKADKPKTLRMRITSFTLFPNGMIGVRGWQISKDGAELNRQLTPLFGRDSRDKFLRVVGPSGEGSDT